VSEIVPPRRSARPSVTVPLRDVVLNDREQAFYGPQLGDWLLLALLVVILLGNGFYIWHQMGLGSHAGRAIFFGLLLMSVLWAALVYMLKLSVCVRIGPHGMSVVRGPWRTELAWRDVARLLERVQRVNGQRYRWLIAFARDGRRLQVREDMVTDYLQFKLTVHERYRLWSDHGGTWGATGGGPYTAHESVASQTFWWAVLAVCLLLPGAYFALLLPEVGPLGLALVFLSICAACMSVRSALRRRVYVVDARAIEVRQPGHVARLPWRDVIRVERSRHPFGGMVRVGITIGRFLLNLVARTDPRVESFDWSPRVPEYLTLRGAGRHVRIHLHRLERPDEMLAWVEFYERVGKRLSEQEPRRAAATSRRLTSALPAPARADEIPDLGAKSGPADPWGSGREGVPDEVETDVSASDADYGIPQSGAVDANSSESAPAWLVGRVPQDAPVVGDAANSTAVPGATELDSVESETSRFPVVADAAPSSESVPAHQDPPYVPAEQWGNAWPIESEASGISVPSGQQAAYAVNAWPDEGTDGDDSVPDEWSEFVGDEDAPTSAIETLADSFAPWREAGWERPQLPRFGPPPSSEESDEP